MNTAKDFLQARIVQARPVHKGQQKHVVSARGHLSEFAVSCRNLQPSDVRESAGMQQVWVGTGSTARLVDLPARSAAVLPGVSWGSPDVLNTPAYWAVRCRWEGDISSYSASGATLTEETGFCLLGGYGIRYEVNEAAYVRLRAAGVFDLGQTITEADIRALLFDPLEVEGRLQRYRFPNQRAARIAAMRRRFCEIDYDGHPALALRDMLMKFDGIGPKTASWIVRNHLDSDDVAILDVHVIRACCAMNVFKASVRLPQGYSALERRFLSLANAIGIRPSILDAVMWSEVRTWRTR